MCYVERCPRAQRGRVVVRYRLTSCLCMWEGYEGWIFMNINFSVE